MQQTVEMEKQDLLKQNENLRLEREAFKKEKLEMSKVRDHLDHFPCDQSKHKPQ